jgi:hypothetical protein
VSLSFLYDEDSGVFSALQAVVDSRRLHPVGIYGGAGDWIGAAMYCESAETTFDATGVATCSATLTGELVFT